jgi:hypothetical protein
VDRARITAWLPLLAVILTALIFEFPPPMQSETEPIKIFPDSASYLNWGYGRPPTPYLYYSVIGSRRAAVIAQTVLSLACWSAFGYVALGVLGAVFAAGLAGSLWISLWNYGVLSEAPTLSFGALLLAATLLLGRQWTRPRFVLWALTALLFSNIRVENFFLVPFLLGTLLLWHRAHWKALAAVGAVAVSMFVFFGVLLDKQNHNWHIRMTNVVLTRILPDPVLADFFFARGLPREDTLLAAKGRMLAAYDPPFVESTPQFQHWLEHGSREAYSEWLTGVAPHRRLVDMLDHTLSRSPYGHEYYTAGVALPGAAMNLNRLWDGVRLPFSTWLWLAAIPVACAAVTRRIRFPDLLALAYLAAVYSLAFIVYHGDSGELERHMVFVGALYRMAPVMALACVWDRLRERWQ